MALIESIGIDVTLDQLLAAKERRAARQLAWLSRYGQSLISLTLVTPGPVKDAVRYRQLMEEAINVCHRMLASCGWQVTAWQAFWLPTERFSLAKKLNAHGNSLEAMIASLEKNPPVRVRGTAVFMSRSVNIIPFALLHNLKHNKILHERVILLTVRTEHAPYVHNVRRVTIEQLSPTFWRVVARYGWLEAPNMPEVFHRCGLEGLPCQIMETSFFMSHESLILTKRPWYLFLRGKLFVTLSRNALRAADEYEIPPNRVIELGTQVEI